MKKQLLAIFLGLVFFLMPSDAKALTDSCQPKGIEGVTVSNGTRYISRPSTIKVEYDLTEVTTRTKQACGGGISSDCYTVRYCEGRGVDGCFNRNWVNARTTEFLGNKLVGTIDVGGYAETGIEVWYDYNGNGVCADTDSYRVFKIAEAICEDGWMKVVDAEGSTGFLPGVELFGIYDTTHILNQGPGVNTSNLRLYNSDGSSIGSSFNARLSPRLELGILPVGNYYIRINGITSPTCKYPFSVTVNGGDDNRQGDDFVGDLIPYSVCNQIPDPVQNEKCQNCYDRNTTGNIWTAVGCIPTRDPIQIIRVIMQIGLGLSGGISILMLLAAGFNFSTSMGDPKRTGEARDQLVSAIVGIFFTIFSISILQFIGYSVLRIPGIGG